MNVYFLEKAEPVTSTNANTLSSDIVALAPAPSAPPPSLAMVSRQMGDSKPPQAIVKPQILTHIIEGFVIQEGAEPFPVRAGPEGGAFILATAPGLGCGVAPLGYSCALTAWQSRPPPLTSDVGMISWQVDGETMEMVRDFIFLAPKSL